MKIIDEKISTKELSEMASKMFGDLVKAVVDVENCIMVVDAELHADEESLLIEKGSQQKDLWGVNLYPEFYGEEDFIEFDSMINLRPSQGNRSRGVEDETIRKKVVEIISNLVIK
ncbi:MAG: DUF5674 family protein [Patescibacteria group bacterium]|nr:DUF5674 family protein [Patescibacteria group bacterium]